MEAGAGQAGEDVADDWRRRRNNLRRDSPDTRASRNVACGLWPVATADNASRVCVCVCVRVVAPSVASERFR
jgi:hypothetical protein